MRLCCCAWGVQWQMDPAVRIALLHATSCVGVAADTEMKRTSLITSARAQYRNVSNRTVYLKISRCSRLLLLAVVIKVLAVQVGT